MLPKNKRRGNIFIFSCESINFCSKYMLWMFVFVYSVHYFVYEMRREFVEEANEVRESLWNGKRRWSNKGNGNVINLFHRLQFVCVYFDGAMQNTKCIWWVRVCEVVCTCWMQCVQCLQFIKSSDGDSMHGKKSKEDERRSKGKNRRRLWKWLEGNPNDESKQLGIFNSRQLKRKLDTL